MIKLDKYIKDTRDFSLIAESENIPSSMAMLKASQAKIDEVRDNYEAKPKRSPDDLTQDLVYQLGLVEGIKWVLRLPERSREYLKKLK